MTSVTTSWVFIPPPRACFRAKRIEDHFLNIQSERQIVTRPHRRTKTDPHRKLASFPVVFARTKVRRAQRRPTRQMYMYVYVLELRYMYMYMYFGTWVELAGTRYGTATARRLSFAWPAQRSILVKL